MGEGDVVEGPVLVAGPVVERAFDDPCADGFGDGFCRVGGAGIEHPDVVGPRYGPEAAGEVLFFVFCKD